jgi:hypothetical protein
MYRIREVDGHDDEIADTLADIHRLTFFGGASVPNFDWGHWWLAFHETMPVAFAGVVPSTRASNAGYFCRVGVLMAGCWMLYVMAAAIVFMSCSGDTAMI